MTVLESSPPTLSDTDTFALTYHGTYTRTLFVPDKDRAGGGYIDIEEIEGPLPTKRFLWGGKDVLGGMEAGQMRLVPFDIVRLYFGDPRSVPGEFGRVETKNSKVGIGDIVPREQEIRRLCVLYGLYETHMDLLPKAVPACTITTADGIEVICPAIDPDGD